MLRRLLSAFQNLHLFTAVGLVSLYNLVAFQAPLWGYATSVSGADRDGALQILSLQVLQLGLLASFLLLISAISIRLMKLVAGVILITNAAALYFMQSYGVELDIAMIGNILGTDAREVSELWHWSIWVYMGLLGLAPAVLLWCARLRKPRLWARIAAPVVTFAALLAALFAMSVTWLWYDQHATRLGARILPWSYVINTARHYNKAALRDRDIVLLPDATFETEPTAKEIVVLVVGEAARADNLQHYGYPRETNEFTQDLSLAVLPVGQSCATYTIGGTACILTHEGREASPRTTFESLPSYLTRSGIETYWRTNSGGTPPIDVTLYERARQIAAGCAGAACPDPNLDEALIYGLADTLAASDADRIFVGLHQTGSHGPSYYRKFPSAFAHFMPQCETVQVSKCTEQELYNAYDNTLRYTDFLLSELIAQLDSIPNANVVILYTADHGQSLGENGFYLHGTPPAVAPPEQRRVPFLVWMSDGFQQSRGLSNADITPAITHPHDIPFHSVMGAFGMRSDIYKPQYDIFSSAGGAGQR